MRFVDKATDEPGNPTSCSLALANLVKVRVLPESKVGGTVRVGCEAKANRRFRLEATLAGFESRGLFEIDTEEEIEKVANQLDALCHR